MNKLSGIDEDLLRTADLAAREEFRLGDALVNPSTRTIRGPGGEADLEPRVMQVLVVLADAAGSVVTRETLFHRCWGNVFVGDDSLNRAVAGVRKVAASVAAGSFTVETVPRTGYQLVVRQGVTPGGEAAALPGPVFTTRRLVVGGAVAAVAAGAIGSAIWLRHRSDPEFVRLMARGDQALKAGDYNEPGVIPIFEQAVRLEPGSARAWGLLAYFRYCRLADLSRVPSDDIVDGATLAARRALQIDPKEPTALTAQLALQGGMLGMAAQDKRLRSIVDLESRNIPALRELMVLVQGAGMTRESWQLNERILALAPLSRPHLSVRALKLWIMGDVAASDKVIDSVRGLWPNYFAGYSVRLITFALTDRPRAARALINGSPKLAQPQSIPMWQSALRALETRSIEDIRDARVQCLSTAKDSPVLANIVAMLLGALGETDSAFDVINGFLLSRGSVVSANLAQSNPVNNFNRRLTPWLFTPPMAELRADPRFPGLCKELGLDDYWRTRGVQPDYLNS